MTSRLLCVLTLAAIAIAIFTSHAVSQDPSPDAMAEMMKKMKAVTSPNERHKELERFLGTWDVEAKMVMPGMPPQASKCTAEIKWLIPGRWLGEELKGTLMGSPYHSFWIHGYDVYAKNYVTCGVNNMDTSMITLKGTVVDPTNKMVVQYGKLDEYTTGELNKPIKSVMKIVDKDHHTLEVYDLGIGEHGAVVLEFNYSRKKS